MLEKNIHAFRSDVMSNNGYLYTNTDRLSCKLSISRTSQAIQQVLGCVKGKKIIDIGCGDGTFTQELIELGPAFITGIDPNDAAIKLARKNMQGIKNIEFQIMDIYSLPLIKKYDIAVIRGVLHHLDEVEKAIEIICNIAHKIVVVEPNGYNPVLKILERFSPYHILHEEKSYFPRKLDQWFINNGGVIVESFYIGLVPIFFPASLAKILKFFEPFFEKIPYLCKIFCGQYVQKIQLNKHDI